MSLGSGPRREAPLSPADTDDDLGLPPILSAALSELRHNGYHGTTVRTIVNEAGLTMPTLYYHYGNKQGVLVALLDIAMDALLSDLTNIVGDSGTTDATTRLRQAVWVTVHHMTHRHAFASLHREYRFLDADARATYVARRRAVDARLEAILADGVRDGAFRIDDIEYTKLAILGMLQGIADWYRKDGPDTPEAIADRYELLVLRLVGA